MHQVSIVRQCEVRQSGSTLCALELEGGGPDEAVVVQTIEEGMTVVHVIDALRIATANSILTDRVFDNSTVWFADSAHGESAGSGLAWDRCCRGTETQREEYERNHPV